MAKLVAIDLPGGDAFVSAIQRVWDRGDAVLPVDQRLPPMVASALMAEMGAASVIGVDGERNLNGGKPTEPGDALVVPTSGSTGRPKGVVLTHDAVVASANATSRRIGVGAGDRWLACLPMAHVGGLAVVTRALHTGVALTVLPRFEPESVTAAARAGATLTSLVPTTLARIDSTIFRRIVLGGSRPPADRPANTVATYGLTETGSGVVYDGVPLEDVEVETAADGEVLIRCPMQLRGYRDGTTPVDADGWLHTDDIGRWREDGRLDVDGRRGDLIISGGENIWPDVVEAEIGEHPDVADVGVAGVDDPEWGQLVTAWIVPVDASHPPSVAEIRAWVGDRLPRFMAPRSLVIVDSLSRTTAGKIRRSALAASEGDEPADQPA